MYLLKAVLIGRSREPHRQAGLELVWILPKRRKVQSWCSYRLFYLSVMEWRWYHWSVSWPSSGNCWHHQNDAKENAFQFGSVLVYLVFTVSASSG